MSLDTWLTRTEGTPSQVGQKFKPRSGRMKGAKKSIAYKPMDKGLQKDVKEQIKDEHEGIEKYGKMEEKAREQGQPEVAQTFGQIKNEESKHLDALKQLQGEKPIKLSESEKAQIESLGITPNERTFVNEQTQGHSDEIFAKMSQMTDNQLSKQIEDWTHLMFIASSEKEFWEKHDRDESDPHWKEDTEARIKGHGIDERLNGLLMRAGRNMLEQRRQTEKEKSDKQFELDFLKKMIKVKPNQPKEFYKSRYDFKTDYDQLWREAK